MRPDSPIAEATRLVDERKAALLNASPAADLPLEQREMAAGRLGAIRGLVSGTDIRPDELHELVDLRVRQLIADLHQAPMQAIGAVLAGYLAEGFMHGYHARRLETQEAPA